MMVARSYGITVSNGRYQPVVGGSGTGSLPGWGNFIKNHLEWAKLG